MRFNTAVLLLSLTLAGAAGAQSSNPKYIKEQNDHARAMQQKAQAARQQDNRSVNNNSQQQRYNNTRPTSAYKPPAQTYKAPAPVYRPSAATSYSSSSYKRK